jgi:hypothetical protein
MKENAVLRKLRIRRAFPGNVPRLICISLISAGVLIGTPCCAHPLDELLELTIEAFGEGAVAEGAAGIEFSAAKLATSSAFRESLFVALENNGKRTLAAELRQAWSMAESPRYAPALQEQVAMLSSFQKAGLALQTGSSEPDNARLVANELITDSLNTVPLESFHSVKALEAALNDEIKNLAKQESTASHPRFSFEVASGKLTVDSSIRVGAGEIKVGEVNLYKVTAALAAMIVCGDFGCVEKAATALFGEGEGLARETPAVARERQVRSNSDKGSEDPLAELVHELEQQARAGEAKTP